LGEGRLKEELREIERKIAEIFEKARGQAPQTPKLSEEERLARTGRYAEILYRAALKQVGR